MAQYSDIDGPRIVDDERLYWPTKKFVEQTAQPHSQTQHNISAPDAEWFSRSTKTSPSKIFCRMGDLGNKGLKLYFENF